MSKFVPLLNNLPDEPAQADIGFFDPPLYCPTGVCGPSLDQTYWM